jgi:DNA-binding response OmpR family regulator
MLEPFSMSTARKVLLVDDDDDLRTSLKDQLVLHDEFEVHEAGTATKGMEAARNGRFDLVVFDVGLPDMDGREAVKLLRRSGYKTPIVMLTGNTSDADQILGLDAGANDYVLKPFKFAVFLARIRAQLRQHEQSEDAVFAIGPYTADRKRNVDSQISLSLGRQGRLARCALARSLGLQCRGHDPYARNAHLQVASENRKRSVERRASDYRKRRLQAGSLNHG